jgi:hypothetical protein
MKKLSQLQDFFYEKIYPDLEFLEIKRVKIFNYLKIVGIVLTILSFVIFAYLNKFVDFFSLVIPVLGTFITIFTFIYKIKVAGFSSLYKDFVIEKLVLFVDKSLRYDKFGKISKHEYKKSQLFSQPIDRFSGDDLVSGNINGIDIKFSELHHKVKVENDKGRTYYQTVFQGIFFIADFNKNFKGTTIVLPDSSEKFLGSLSHIFQSFSGKGELVKLDNPEFEKEFVVYSNDQIEARYILSHSLMQNILNLKRAVEQNLYISFIDSKIYIAIHFNKNLFEPKIYKKVANFDDIKFYFQTISLSVDIVQYLNLDRKIWTKR